jgi:hypothetical protein
MGTIYVNSTTGNDSTGNGSFSSPFASVGKANSVAVSLDTISIAGGMAYLSTTSTPNVSGGVLILKSGITYLGTGPTPPILRASGITNCNLVALDNPGEQVQFQNIDIDCNNLSGVRGFITLGGSSRFSILKNLRFYNCVATESVVGGTDLKFIRCLYKNNTGQIAFKANGADSYLCVAVGNASWGFFGTGRYSRCFSLNNQIGFYFNNSQGEVENCLAHGNSGSAFQNDGGSGRMQAVRNSIAWGNGGWAIQTQNNDLTNIIRFAHGNNTSGFKNATTRGDVDAVPLSVNPFVNSSAVINTVDDAITNFALNDAIEGGLLCRGSAEPAGLDIGAIQSVASSGVGRRTIKL